MGLRLDREDVTLGALVVGKMGVLDTTFTATGYNTTPPLPGLDWGVLPSGATGQLLAVNADGSLGWSTSSTVTSQTQNYVFAAPSGSSGLPIFRALVATDIPASLTSINTATGYTNSIGGALVAGTILQVYSAAAGNIALAVRGAGSQTGDLQQWQNSTPSVVSSIHADGSMNLPVIADGSAVNSSL